MIRRLSLGSVGVLLLGACAGTTTGSGGPGDDGADCVSSYDPVAAAATWPALRRKMLRHEPAVRDVAVRARGDEVDVGGTGEDVVRVVDLVDGRGRRVTQVDVWRTEDGGWRAGTWSQCID